MANGKLAHLVPDMPEVTAAGGPNAIRALKTLTDHVGSLTMAIRHIAEAQDQNNASILVIDARWQELSRKLESHRETSKHDIDLAIEGSLEEAIERAMSDKEKLTYKSLVEERKAEDRERARDLRNAKTQRNGAIVAGLVILVCQLLAAYFQAAHH